MIINPNGLIVKDNTVPESYKYTLEYVKQLSERVDNGQSKAVSLRHDDSLHHWRISFELEPQRYWFLTVFVSDNGNIDKYSIDYEAASDSHYEFKDESSVRKLFCTENNEKQYLHELFIKYVEKHGGFELLKLIHSLITAEFHYD